MKLMAAEFPFIVCATLKIYEMRAGAGDEFRALVDPVKTTGSEPEGSIYSAYVSNDALLESTQAFVEKSLADGKMKLFGSPSMVLERGRKAIWLMGGEIPVWTPPSEMEESPFMKLVFVGSEWEMEFLQYGDSGEAHLALSLNIHKLHGDNKIRTDKRPVIGTRDLEIQVAMKEKHEFWVPLGTSIEPVKPCRKRSFCMHSRKKCTNKFVHIEHWAVLSLQYLTPADTDQYPLIVDSF